MIIGTITIIVILLGGGGMFSLDAFRSAIKDHVADKDRQEQVIELTKQWDNELKDYGDHVKNRADKAHKLLRDYGARRDDFEAFFKDEDWRREKAVERLLDLRFQAKDLVTADEWKAVYDQVIQEAAEKK